MTYEDFRPPNYTEVDPDNVLSQTITRATWTHMDRNFDAWLWKDYGANYFGDFEHIFDFEVTEMEAGDYNERLSAWLYILTKTNVAGTPPDALLLYVAQKTNYDTQFKLTFYQHKNSINQFSSVGFCILDVGVKYYAKISRDGTTCRCIIYSDAERTNVVGDTGNKEGVSDSYRYLQTTKGFGSSNDPDDWSSGYVENLNLQKISPKKLVLKLGTTMGIALEDISKKDTVIMV